MFVLKSLLRENYLNSPANGHLGGYALLNMVSSLNPRPANSLRVDESSSCSPLSSSPSPAPSASSHELPASSR
jgi:hypothetical protein